MCVQSANPAQQFLRSLCTTWKTLIWIASQPNSFQVLAPNIVKRNFKPIRQTSRLISTNRCSCSTWCSNLLICNSQALEAHKISSLNSKTYPQPKKSQAKPPLFLKNREEQETLEVRNRSNPTQCWPMSSLSLWCNRSESAWTNHSWYLQLTPSSQTTSSSHSSNSRQQATSSIWISCMRATERLQQICNQAMCKNTRPPSQWLSRNLSSSSSSWARSRDGPKVSLAHSKLTLTFRRQRKVSRVYPTIGKRVWRVAS